MNKKEWEIIYQSIIRGLDRPESYLGMSIKPTLKQKLELLKELK